MKKSFTISKIALFLGFAVLFASCGKNGKKLTYTMENDSLVEEITSSYVSRLSDIRITFLNEIECPVEKAISFNPPQKGIWSLSDDNRTAVFSPEKPYKSNAEFTLVADCGKLFESKGESGKYTHPFITTTPSYNIAFNEMSIDENNSYSISGSVNTDIPVSLESAKKVLKASYKGLSKSKPVIEWDSEKAFDNSRNFKITNIKSLKPNTILSVSWKGTKLGLSKLQDKHFAGSKLIKIPASNIFSILDINTSKKNSILVSFSKFIDTAQNISGFVKAFDINGKPVAITNSSIHQNVLTIYSDTNFESIATVAISDGIKSTDGYFLADSKTVSLPSKWEKPAVKFMNNGNILPTTQGTTLTVSTMNLQGLLIQVYQIPERNMIQFFQVNELNNDYEMYRVGEPVWEKHINLNWDNSMKNKFVNHGIVITDLVKKYPNGMFQIRISFRQKDIKYVCDATHDDFSNIPMPEDKIEPDFNPYAKTHWDNYWDGMSYEIRRTFWNNNNDPCHPAYYMANYNRNSLIKRNIIISDIGLIAKRDTDGNLYVTASNLKDATPYQNIEISAYNYTGAKINSIKTGASGTVVFKQSDDIIFVVADNKSQKSYLKLSDGSQLSISHFETGGEKAKNGVKGFIYGERGVWRPGDNMYLTFILQDLEKALPKDIPVSFELTDPHGKIVEQQSLTVCENGFYPIVTKTSAEGETGLYTGHVKIGGREWTKSLRVETILPNKLSVKLSVENDVIKSTENNFTLEGAWLHGASVAGYKADVSVNFTETETSFPEYKSYTFSNPLNKFESRRETIWEGELESSSTVTFTKQLDAGNNLPGMLNANMISRIFEPSGAFSTEYTTIKYSPYERYVGIKIPKGDEKRNMLLTDTKHTADVIYLNEDGTPVQEGNLKWEVYKIQWKWWWEKDAYSNAGYVYDNNFVKVASGDVSIKNGKGNFKFEVKYPEWGRYLIAVAEGTANGHSAGKIAYIDWPGWAGRTQEGDSGGAAMIALTTDKTQYKTGETASVSFASGKGARALVTIEKNGLILKQEWLETDKDTTVFKFNLTPEMSPNVYVHMTMLQPHLQTANSLPIRLYGIVPIMIDNPDTSISPVITAAEKFEPNTNATISVSEKDGKQMTYTLAVVDEGLLGLTNYHAPNPRNEFYKKEASQIENWDLYSYVMNAYTGKLETMLAIGGGDDIINPNANDTNRFAPVVEFFGPFTLKPGEKKATTFTMPHYVGAVRAMVIAGDNGAYGYAEKSVPVKSDLMIQSSIPRTIGIGEKIRIPVTLFNGTDKTQDVTVNLSATGAVNTTRTEQISIEPSSEGIVTFILSAETAGIINFNFEATDGTYKAQETVQVPVKSRGINVTYKNQFEIKGGKSQTIVVPSPIEKGTGEYSIEVSSLPPLDLQDRLGYLISYPHGCIEQITSSAFPQLYLPDFAKLSPQQIEETKQNVNSVLERYTNYQTISGGFAYWQGMVAPSEWGTCYAVHFMTEAKKKGYSIPENVYNAAVKYIQDKATTWYSKEENSTDEQAYRLFVLALARKVDLGSMNRLLSSTLSDSAALMLASAYGLSGNKATAQKLFNQVNPKSIFRQTGQTFNSSKRITAMCLLTATTLNDEKNAKKFSKQVCSNLSSSDWMSTQEIAWSLFSLMPYYISAEKTNSNYAVETNGTKNVFQLEKVVDMQNLALSDEAEQKASVSNIGKKTLYGTLTLKGFSVPGTEANKADGLRLDVKYLNRNGMRVDFAELLNGDSFEIVIEATNTTLEKIENTVLTMLIPTAWEIANDRIGQGETQTKEYTYQDIRDDRISTFFDLESGKTITLTFNATKVYEGSYYIPAISAEAMYDAAKGGIIAGTYIEHRFEELEEMEAESDTTVAESESEEAAKTDDGIESTEAETEKADEAETAITEETSDVDAATLEETDDSNADSQIESDNLNADISSENDADDSEAE